MTIVDYRNSDNGNCQLCNAYCKNNTRTEGFCPRCLLDMKIRVNEVLNEMLKEASP